MATHIVFSTQHRTGRNCEISCYLDVEIRLIEAYKTVGLSNNLSRTIVKIWLLNIHQMFRKIDSENLFFEGQKLVLDMIFEYGESNGHTLNKI